MKRIYLLIVIVSFGLRVSAGEDSTFLSRKIDTLSITINARIDTLSKGIEPLKDTIRKIVNDQLIVDASALDSARKFPDSVLYKTYLFSKKSQCHGQEYH